MKLPEFAPHLSPADEVIQHDKMARYQRGKLYERARNKLIMAVMKEAVGYLRSRCTTERFSDGELISLCYRALFRAAANFKPRRAGSVNFFRYAKPYLRGFLWAECKHLDRLQGYTTLSAKCKMDTPLKQEEPEEEPEDKTEVPLVESLQVEPRFDDIHTRERWKIIQPFLSVLNKHEAEIIRLFYFAGLKLAEIANQRKVSRQAVQATHNRALLKIRRALIRKRLL